MLHLIKLSVGPEKLSDLANWQKQRLAERQRLGEKPELIHITRQMPKRADELLDGGSIYWIIKGWICARQMLIELRPMEIEGVPHCGLVIDKTLVRVQPRKHRPFQGWRYFEPASAPRDLRKGEEELSDEMQRELSALGLL